MPGRVKRSKKRQMEWNTASTIFGPYGTLREVSRIYYTIFSSGATIATDTMRTIYMDFTFDNLSNPTINVSAIERSANEI